MGCFLSRVFGIENHSYCVRHAQESFLTYGGEVKDPMAGIDGLIEGGVQQDCVRPNRG